MKTTQNLVDVARFKSGLFQTEVAEKLGVSKQTVSNWENQIYQPMPKMQNKIIELFGLEREELFVYDEGK